jgi:hypothetical protein
MRWRWRLNGNKSCFKLPVIGGVLKALESTEVHAWLDWFKKVQDRDSQYVHSDKRGLFFTHAEASCIDLEYPPKLERLSFFARLLSTIGYGDEYFQGALLWFTEWGVWNLSDEGVGYRIIEAMHRGSGQPMSFEAAPGHLFRADELADAIGMLMQAMIFGWDAYYYPRWSYGTGDVFLHVSHDSFVTIATRTKAFYDKVFGILEELNLHPKAGHESQVRRFCRTS